MHGILRRKDTAFIRKQADLVDTLVHKVCFYLSLARKLALPYSKAVERNFFLLFGRAGMDFRSRQELIFRVQ